jgi:hypothetical protein
MKNCEKTIARIGSAILCLLLLPFSLLAFSACDQGPEKDADANGSSSGKEEHALHFDLIDAAYFYEACYHDPASGSEEPRDASDYFKTEKQGRRYLLENAHLPPDPYLDRYYGEQISQLAQLTKVSLLQKEYPVTFCGYERTIDPGDYSAPVYTLGLDEYLCESTSDHALFVSYTVNDGQLHSVTLPAEEFDASLPATADLTAEQGKAYATQILSAMGYSAEGYEVSVYDNKQSEEGERTLLRVTFTGESFGNAFVGYTVAFECQEWLSFPELVTVTRYQPYMEGAPGVTELVAQPDYEQKAIEDALTIMKQDLNDQGYLDRLECTQVIARPGADGTVSLLVCFEDEMGSVHEDHSEFAVTVLLIVKP